MWVMHSLEGEGRGEGNRIGRLTICFLSFLWASNLLKAEATGNLPLTLSTRLRGFDPDCHACAFFSLAFDLHRSGQLSGSLLQASQPVAIVVGIGVETETVISDLQEEMPLVFAQFDFDPTGLSMFVNVVENFLEHQGSTECRPTEFGCGFLLSFPSGESFLSTVSSKE